MEGKVGRPRKPANILRIPVAVSLTLQELQVLEEVATKLNVTRTQVVREALRMYLAKLNEEGREVKEDVL